MVLLSLWVVGSLSFAIGIYIFIGDQVFPRYENRLSYEGGGVNPLVRGGLESYGEVPYGGVSSIRGGALGSKLSPSPLTSSSPSSCDDGESSNSMAEQVP